MAEIKKIAMTRFATFFVSVFLGRVKKNPIEVEITESRVSSPLHVKRRKEQW